ncbi:hypothetical protein, partial [Shewanella indica]
DLSSPFNHEWCTYYLNSGNPINGQVYNIRDNGNLRVLVDIDGNGIFNKLAAKVTKSLLKVFKPNFFQQELNSILSSIHNHKYYVAGIESVIPDNTWIINGMDLGFEIKNTLKGIHPEKYISIAISEKTIDITLVGITESTT